MSSERTIEQLRTLGGLLAVDGLDHSTAICKNAVATIQQQSAEIARLKEQGNEPLTLHTIALIRIASGYGSKPMLSELAGLVAKDYAELAALREVVGRIRDTGMDAAQCRLAAAAALKDNHA